MILVRISVLSLCLLVTTLCQAREPIELKAVPFDTFMHNEVATTIPLAIPVPSDYEAVQLPNTPVGYSYWMNPQDAEEGRKTGNLPA
jgi:hypothetical protein